MSMLISIESLPDETWTSREDMPKITRKILELYYLSQQNDVDAKVQNVDYDTIMELYDDIRNSDSKLVCAKTQEGELAGVGVFHHSEATNTEPTHTFIEGVAIDPEHRGLGVSRSIVKEIAKRAIEAGSDEIHAQSQPSALEANLRTIKGSGLSVTSTNKGDYVHLSVPIRETLSSKRP